LFCAQTGWPSVSQHAPLNNIQESQQAGFITIISVSWFEAARQTGRASILTEKHRCG
jgi:hypothetical protein